MWMTDRIAALDLPGRICLGTIVLAIASAVTTLSTPPRLDPKTTVIEVGVSTHGRVAGYVSEFRQGEARLVDHDEPHPSVTEVVGLPDDVWWRILRRAQDVEPGVSGLGECADSNISFVRVRTPHSRFEARSPGCDWGGLSALALESVADPAAHLFTTTPH